MQRHLLPLPLRQLSAALLIAFAPAAWATTYNVNSSATLRAALASAAHGDVINFTGNVTLTSADLPALQKNLTVEGNGYALSGNNQFRGLFVYAGTTSVKNLNIVNTVATGGAGGYGGTGSSADASALTGAAGGGGAGLGGGLFVNAGAVVTISNVQFSGAAAQGGAGGDTGRHGDQRSYNNGYGGGGGMGQNGRGVVSVSAGGGGGGLGRVPFTHPYDILSGIVLGAASGGHGAFNPQTPGANGGNGTAGSYGAHGSVDGAGGGGGVGGRDGSSLFTLSTGGGGGYGGGGGGGQVGGTGGFGGGGGGGANGGRGGFGGGGGSGATAGAGGFGAGAGSTYATTPYGVTGGGGGGGAGLGGALFVAQGGTLTIAGNTSASGGSAVGGQGGVGGYIGWGYTTVGSPGGNGSGYGAGMFLQGNGSLSLSPGAGQTQSFADAIADQTGSGGTGANAGSWALVKTGAGTLALLGQNTYSGGTQINAGVVQINSASSLGSGAVSFAGGTLQLGAGTVTLGNAVVLNTGGGTLLVDSGASLTFAQAVSGSGGFSKTGAGTLALLGQNTYSGGTQINAGVVQINSAASLGSGAVSLAGGTLHLAAGTVTLGNAVVLNTGGGSFQVDGGASLALTQAVGGSGGFSKTGAGTLALNAGLTTQQLALSAGTLAVSTATITAGGTGAMSGGSFSGTLVNNGSFRYSGGNFNGALSNASAGTLSLTTVLQAGGAVVNQGRVDLDGPSAGLVSSTLRNDGVINVTGDGIRLNGGATLGVTAAGQYITHNGKLVVDHATLAVTSHMLNAMTSTVEVKGGSWASFQGSFAGGQVDVAADSVAFFLGQVLRVNGVDFSGAGTKYYNGGLGMFFDMPGLMVDAGSVFFGSANVLTLAIGGTTECTSACFSDVSQRYSHYSVAGGLALDGVLKLGSASGFVAQAGDHFDLLDWDRLQGRFSGIDTSGFKLAAGTRLDTSRLYTTGEISISAVPEPGQWALLLAGLLGIGVIAGRRRLAQAAGA